MTALKIICNILGVQFYGETNYLAAKKSLNKLLLDLVPTPDKCPDVPSWDIAFMKEMKLNEPIPVGNGVTLVDVEIIDGSMAVLNNYTKGGVVYPHKHSDMHEYNKIIKGRIKELVSGFEYGEGEDFYVRPNTVHHTVALEDSIVLRVVYKDWNLNDFNSAPKIF